MLSRHAISNADLVRIEPLLPVRAGEPGRVNAGHRLLFNAVLGMARTGAPWRDLPEHFGHWNSA